MSTEPAELASAWRLTWNQTIGGYSCLVDQLPDVTDGLVVASEPLYTLANALRTLATDEMLLSELPDLLSDARHVTDKGIGLRAVADLIDHAATPAPPEPVGSDVIVLDCDGVDWVFDPDLRLWTHRREDNAPALSWAQLHRDLGPLRVFREEA